MPILLGPVPSEPTPGPERVSRSDRERSRSLLYPDRIGPGVPTRGCDLEARQVVRPSLRMRGDFVVVRQSRVDEVKQRVVAVLLEVDLDLGRALSHDIVFLPSEGVDEPSRRIDLDV